MLLHTSLVNAVTCLSSLVVTVFVFHAVHHWNSEMQAFVCVFCVCFVCVCICVCVCCVCDLKLLVYEALTTSVLFKLLVHCTSQKQYVLRPQSWGKKLCDLVCQVAKEEERRVRGGGAERRERGHKSLLWLCTGNDKLLSPIFKKGGQNGMTRLDTSSTFAKSPCQIHTHYTHTHIRTLSLSFPLSLSLTHTQTHTNFSGCLSTWCLIHSSFRVLLLLTFWFFIFCLSFFLFCLSFFAL